MAIGQGVSCATLTASAVILGRVVKEHDANAHLALCPCLHDPCLHSATCTACCWLHYVCCVGPCAWLGQSSSCAFSPLPRSSCQMVWVITLHVLRQAFAWAELEGG